MPTADKKTEQANKFRLALNQQKRLILWIIFAVILALGYFTVLQGKISKLREFGVSGLSAKTSELNALNVYSQKLAELDVKIKSFQEKYKQAAEDLNQILPSKAQIPELIAGLDALVRQSGFTIGALDIAEAVKNDQQANAAEAAVNLDSAAAAAPVASVETNSANIRSLDITITVTGGDYPAFKVLLNKIEKNIRLLDLVSIKFSAGSSGGETGGAAGEGYSLILRTYYFSVPNEL